MSKVRGALLRSMEASEALRNCHLACGVAPPRGPPSEKEIDAARVSVCAALGVPLAHRSLRHPASPLRYALSQALTAAAQDSDVHVAEWLREGAPLGIDLPIRCGDHFPLYDGPAPAPRDLLMDSHSGVEEPPELCGHR